jgi:hypothetical protein
VATTDATVPDVAMTDKIHAPLAGRELLPAQHYLDSGYPSAALVVDSLHRWGVTLVTPLLADQSRQAKQAAGYDRAGFTIDFDTLKATCPQGQSSICWNEVTQRGTHAIVIKFAAATCRPCPVRDQCTRTTHPQYGRPTHRAPTRGPPRPTRRPGRPGTPRSGRPTTPAEQGSREPSAKPSRSPGYAAPATADYPKPGSNTSTPRSHST